MEEFLKQNLPLLGQVFRQPVTGVLDLGDSGFILLREPNYEAVPQKMIAITAETEIRSGRVPSAEVRSYLKSLS